MPKNNPDENVEVEEVTLSKAEIEKEKVQELKEKADAIGVKYSPNIGSKALADKIEKFISTGDVGLDDKQLAVKAIKENTAKDIKTRELKRSKVTVTNLDPKESQFTTVYQCIITDAFSLAKVIRLNQPIGLEKCLITRLRGKRIQKVMPEVDEHTGKATGNFTTISVPHYNIEFLD